MKKWIINVLLYVFTFVAVILSFVIALYSVCSFKSDILLNNVSESSIILSNQGMFYKLSNFFSIFNNNCTDAVIINEAYSVDYRKPYISFMKARKNFKTEFTEQELEEITGEGVTINYNSDTDTITYGYDYEPINELSNFLQGKLPYSLNYGRYWHGYLLLFRPLLVIFNISQIRMFLLIVLLGLFGYFEYLLNKRFGKNIAIIFGMSLVLSGYLSVSFSLESSSIFLVMMISSIILVKRIDKIKEFSLFLFVVACIANFVDYLTVPLITLGVPVAIYLLKCIEDGKNWKECLKIVIFNSIIWLLGYAGTWVCKWILYDITIGGNVNMLRVGFEQSIYRMQRININVSNGTDYVYTIYDILAKSSLHILLTLGVILTVNKYKLSSKEFDKKTISYFLIALMTIVWYMALANHTVMHYYFTYRQSLIFMLGILLVINQQFLQEKVDDKHIGGKKKKNYV